METLQPKLRFPEFKGDWGRKLFKNTCVVNPTNKKLPNKFIYIDLESVKDGFLYKENEILLDEAPSRAQRLLAKEDVLFQMVRPYQKNNFYFDKEGDYVASTGYAQLRANDSSKFIFQYLHNQIFVDKVIEQCTGSNYPAINSTDLANIFVVFPENNEQTKIANFLSSVDEKLNLLKEKKSLLENYKKGIMQKVFNQEIRFKDDNGNDFEDWKKSILSEVFDYKKGSGLSKDKLDDNGVFECVLYGELYTKYSEVIFEVKSKTNINEGLLSEIGDLLIPSSTTTTGIDLANVTALNFENVLLGGDITVLRSNQEINSVFYAYYLSNHKKEEIASYAQGITIVHLYYSHIKDMIIDLPRFEEQNKIANFLLAIDKKIELVSNQIQDTQEYKKGLLQQMFV